MTEHLKQKLNDSAVLRWSVLALVAFTMLCGYFLTDVMSPLKPMLEKELLWDSLSDGKVRIRIAVKEDRKSVV